MTVNKRIIAVTIAALAVLGLSGCGSSGGTTAPPTSETPMAAETAPPAAEPNVVDSKYGVTIDSSQVGTDYDGKPAIVVTYTFTNNSDKATSFMVAVSAKAFQNGVELGDALVVDGVDSQPLMSDIKPGATITVQDAYLLADQSEVTVEVSELFSLSDDLIATQVFTVQ